MRIPEARLQAALTRADLIHHDTNSNQHRIYMDGQKPQCPHVKYTDSSEHHLASIDALAEIRRKRDAIDECKATGPCSRSALKFSQEEKAPEPPKPPKPDKHLAKLAKHSKAKKVSSSKGKQQKSKRYFSTVDSVMLTSSSVGSLSRCCTMNSAS